jgi:TP901 family phage tail tape measure protein
MANELVIRVRADDQASSVLGSIEGKAKGLGGALGNVVRAGALGGATAIAGLGIASIKMAADFESSFAEVKTLLPDLSEKAFGKLQDDIIGVSKEFGIATNQSIPALYQAISAGVPSDNIVSFMETAAKASIGGVTDLETAVDGITSVVNAYGDEVISAQEASDQMFTAVRLGKTDFTQLSSSLFNVIPTASSLGVSFGDVASQLAVITASGTPTSVATTQIRAAMVEAQKSGSKLDTALRDLSGKGFADLIKDGQTMPQVFETLRQSMPEQDFKDLFGSVEAMNAVLGVTGPNFDAVSSAMDEMSNSAGATDAAAAKIQETFSFKFNKAINEAKIFLMELGLEALPHVTKALEVVVPWLQENLPKAIESARQAFEDMKPALTVLVNSFISGFKTIMPLIEDFWEFLKDNKPLMIAAIIAIGVAIVVAFGPGAIALAAIVGLITAIGLIRDNWDEIKARFESAGVWADIAAGAFRMVADNVQDLIDLIDSIITVVENVVELISALASGDWSLAWTEFKELAEATLNLFLDFLQIGFLDEMVQMFVDFLPTMKEKGIELLDAIWEGFKEHWDDAVYMYFIGFPLLIFETIGDVLTTLAPKGRELLSGMWNGIIERWGEIAGALAGFPELARNALGDVTVTLKQKGRSLLSGFWNGINERWGEIASWLVGVPNRIASLIGSTAGVLFQKGKDLIQGFINGMLSVDIPNPLNLIPGVGGLPGISLPGFDAGGVVPGPIGSTQIIRAHGGETVLPTHKGGGMDGAVTVNLTYAPTLSTASPLEVERLATLLDQVLRGRWSLAGA